MPAVKISHEKNALPEAVKVLLCACQNGFNMAHTYPAYQRDQRHKTVSWSGQLVSELTKGLQACRVL
jgi:POT family proton-dependent oligopeptide transporter